MILKVFSSRMPSTCAPIFLKSFWMRWNLKRARERSKISKTGQNQSETEFLTIKCMPTFLGDNIEIEEEDYNDEDDEYNRAVIYFQPFRGKEIMKALLLAIRCGLESVARSQPRTVPLDCKWKLCVGK
mmetsp:Transcript_22005/g.36423  ORF Transcript_22005/g.36423 Transcript_22005/m.36423 type:complete len:128 (-) Transcript_22005:19-402(-)